MVCAAETPDDDGKAGTLPPRSDVSTSFTDQFAHVGGRWRREAGVLGLEGPDKFTDGLNVPQDGNGLAHAKGKTVAAIRWQGYNGVSLVLAGGDFCYFLHGVPLSLGVIRVGPSCYSAIAAIAASAAPSPLSLL